MSDPVRTPYRIIPGWQLLLSAGFCRFIGRRLRPVCRGEVAAPGAEGAVGAIRPAGPADGPAVKHHAVAEIVGFLRRETGPKLLLGLPRVFGPVGQPKQTRDADAVGIRHHDARRVMDVAQDQVGGLPAHAGEAEQLLHGSGDLPAELGQEHPGGQDDVPGLGTEETAGVDTGLHILRLRCGQSLQRREPGKETGRDLVDPLVGALGRETGGKEQLVILLISKGADAVWIEAFQLLNDGADFIGCLHRRSILSPLFHG